MLEKVYYLSQLNWGKDEFYALHRYLHKMIFYHEKRINEIKSLDVSLMSDETKTILYCLIKYYQFDFLLNIENLKPLQSIKPLNKPLLIDGDTANDDDIYKQMNIIF